jgi:hypothetical protein
LAAGVNVDDTGDEGNFCERFVFLFIKKMKKKYTSGNGVR